MMKSQVCTILSIIIFIQIADRLITIVLMPVCFCRTSGMESLPWCARSFLVMNNVYTPKKQREPVFETSAIASVSIERRVDNDLTLQIFGRQGRKFLKLVNKSRGSGEGGI